MEAEIGLPEPKAFLTELEEGDMVWLDRQEARAYCSEGEEPIALYTADQVRAAILKEREDACRLRELLRRTQTYVCGNRELMGASELCGEIAEALAATKRLRAAAIRSGTSPEQEEKLSEEEFQRAIKELRGEYTAPSEVAEVCARLFEELWQENKRLREEVRRSAEASQKASFYAQNGRPASYF